ncbi:amidase family protein [Candidatus Planktophila lacus]|jgi:amidase|uniref:Amidase n=1 Tax=Candidatus Planktophila lacus TaxID=1884913 RepID=A0AAD0E3I8_9ACTN|nr:amidase family protein [Candidatus Planktophila lacus]ASY10684.1 amidase [Candidatus Planktophila lacus]
MASKDSFERSLSKIAEIDASGYQLNSVLAVSEDLTFNEIDGPLAGVPILIKDNIEALGLPATAGSLALAETPVVRDSTIAKRLRAAGATIIGSTNLSEWANIRSGKSTSGWSAVGGLTANPWKHAHSAGGSSSGSGAAVGAGIVSMAVGSETDGSIVCPASLNGCVGIKPTVGSIPRDAMIPISGSQDTPGPMAQSVAQAALLLEVLTGKSGYQSAVNGRSEIRIGVVKEWATQNPVTNQLFQELVSKLSKQIKVAEISLPSPSDQEGESEFKVLMHELNEDLATYLLTRQGARVKTLQDVVDFNLANKGAELQHFGQEYFDMALKLGGRNRDYQKLRSENLDWAVNRVLAPAFEKFDILIGETYAPAWKSNLGGGDDYGSASWISMAPAIAGTPIGALPMGLVDGLPVAVGVVARANQEDRLVQAMALIERVLDLGVLQPTFTK